MITSPSAQDTSFGAIVVAAGAGTRFGAERPKALLELAGRPLVRHAAESMLAAGAVRLIVVIPDGGADGFARALHGLAVDALVTGGAERTDSVRNGLAALAASEDRPPIVLITDAARPLVPLQVTRRVVAAVAAGAPAVVPAVPVTDTIRELTGPQDDGHGSRMLDRSMLRAVQTPQGFDLETLLAAYRRLGADVITDDAGVCERAGHPITLVDGDSASFKITHPPDLALAEIMINNERQVR
ncbi:2-C-methyl-D-erythritol 4-phosphate cytidylyltransferase [Microlunatus elymi]|uniref:2-C-methyl-D-erythritol 4-phosphate cytidylyltransferase n=1 Tax=Microlunatus elymi TaxID=2596828 RepID=A0A516Q413_9ACTN|nr:2-C-methyl-D-erythritol 4-phosphate cytidylyltransferase [Microlunatus elymi]QDP98187.1 2-C-methyl-D-erythritol 4-phosphate cytidylyltransferase [Microlunatus elymi]